MHFRGPLPDALDAQFAIPAQDWEGGAESLGVCWVGMQSRGYFTTAMLAQSPKRFTKTLTALHSARLSDDEKRDLKRDGFVILRNAVARNVTARAKAVINQDPTKIVHGDNPAINGLYNDSGLRELMLETMGPHTAPINAQVAVTMPHFADAVVRRKANPNYAPGAHVDGGWAGPCPVKRSEILASGQRLETWGSDGDPKSMGPAGGAPLWQNRERTLAIGSYTALVGVCLNDQRRPGKGQFSVRRGAHEAVEAFFRMQRHKGGPLGGGGPAWPAKGTVADAAWVSSYNGT